MNHRCSTVQVGNTGKGDKPRLFLSFLPKFLLEICETTTNVAKETSVTERDQISNKLQQMVTDAITLSTSTMFLFLSTLYYFY